MIWEVITPVRYRQGGDYRLEQLQGATENQFTAKVSEQRELLELKHSKCAARNAYDDGVKALFAASELLKVSSPYNFLPVLVGLSVLSSAVFLLS